ncbi:type 2 isopentenyl-diphosphate Delta-isomerase [Fodinisporobacter ferrooxydans]|uniref:Isopentenyl-diphosphate delta-isomerase n=1 Tax=Fodinisporobacter ferrooxydans TaxID=2901836 RepID=A0ABY4CHH3_9BACL|nr:type 2 isopentenyl-diphosphate Delta-isomerase [Alicyclobacillaceae bacterium MYW30-H2]
MSIESRKIDHLRLAAELPQSMASGFDDVMFVHRTFPEVSFAEISLQTNVAGTFFSAPFWINAMTGGSEPSAQVNRDLAIAARELGLAMAVGSQRAALRDDSLRESYTVVRKENPGGIVIANLSAAATIDDVLRAVDMLDAQYIQLHANAPQELVMPEGDRNFKGILKGVETIIRHCPVPVIIKEVGFGMCRETYRQLTEIGARIVDVSGRGGTNFIAIENQRRSEWPMDDLRLWGQTTVVSLLEAEGFQNQLTFLASGGVRNPLDCIKCLALGAQGVGLAGFILRTYRSSGLQGLIDCLQHWLHEVRVIMTMLGCRTLQELNAIPVWIRGETADWCEVRNIDRQYYANRRHFIS